MLNTARPETAFVRKGHALVGMFIVTIRSLIVTRRLAGLSVQLRQREHARRPRPIPVREWCSHLPVAIIGLCRRRNASHQMPCATQGRNGDAAPRQDHELRRNCGIDTADGSSTWRGALLGTRAACASPGDERDRVTRHDGSVTDPIVAVRSSAGRPEYGSHAGRPVIGIRQRRSKPR